MIKFQFGIRAILIFTFAAAIVMAHNHPSGDPSPSTADLKITRQLVDSGRIIGINVLDHVIIGDRVSTSFAEQGLL